jgi:hypothetical protein
MDAYLLLSMNASVFDRKAENGDYWLNELRSLGITMNRKNEFNDEKELRNLVDSIKRAFLEEYRTI